MITVHIAGIGLCGPGMADWPSGCAVLRGEQPYTAEQPNPAPAILPPAERRRSGQATRYALQVAQEAAQGSAIAATEAAVVFASADADGENLHYILESLATPEHEVSPTRFHNSVHNAAAGYWNIATGARTPANSIAGYDSSFIAGLVEAAIQATVENRPVLLVAFDLPFPPPLNEVRTIAAPFSVALMLTPQPTPSRRAQLTIRLADAHGEQSRCDSAELEHLRSGNPAAHALPLLQSIARHQPQCLVLPWGGNDVFVEVLGWD
ncbi:MAG TPA: beta-ketoacyl synthase chain length factor [Gammaproteobacteria bacterium]